MKVSYEGFVMVNGEVLYRRGFWQRRDAWQWVGKRMSLALSSPRVGEVVSLWEVGGREVCRLDCDRPASMNWMDAKLRRL